MPSSTTPQPKPLTGILVALTTPFKDSTLSLDLPALDSHINHLISCGVHGLVPGGSTGEFTVLSLPERKLLLEQTLTSAANRVPVLAGIGDLSTARTLELAVHAAKVGAAAVMVVPPFYDSLDLEQLREYLSEIHSACDLPICYYNIPSASGLKLSPAEMSGLKDVGVRYVKDTSGDGPGLTEMLFCWKGEVTTFNGWDTLTFYGIAAGAEGCVWGAANLIPELAVELWEAVGVKGDLKKGREIWGRIWPICKLLEEGNYAGAVKTGMEIRGWGTGSLRKPFELLKGEKRERLRRLMVEAGVETVA